MSGMAEQRIVHQECKRVRRNDPQSLLLAYEVTALCLEWCKARARAHRWQEECSLLEEEMRRIKVFFGWQGRYWTEMAAVAGTEGPCAYGCRQAAMRQSMLDYCENAWKDTDEYLRFGTGPLAGE